jgi:hypothetical protein
MYILEIIFFIDTFNLSRLLHSLRRAYLGVQPDLHKVANTFDLYTKRGMVHRVKD